MVLSTDWICKNLINRFCCWTMAFHPVFGCSNCNWRVQSREFLMNGRNWGFWKSPVQPHLWDLERVVVVDKCWESVRWLYCFIVFFSKMDPGAINRISSSSRWSDIYKLSSQFSWGITILFFVISIPIRSCFLGVLRRFVISFQIWSWSFYDVS